MPKLNHTPGPWEKGEFNDYLGYDSMSGGIRVGPVVLDEADYYSVGSDELIRERIEADARLIAAVPRMYEALQKLARLGNEPHYGNSIGNQIARDALKGLED